MKKESLNLGARKACPECKKLFTKAANIIGEGSKVTLSQMCPHCKTQITIEVGHKPYVRVYKTKVAAIIAIFIAISLVLLLGANAQLVSLSDNYKLNAK